MAIDLNTVRKIATLSRLKIPQEEQEKVASDLNRILGWVEQLDEVDVTGIEPLTSVNDRSLRMREDAVNDGGDAKSILANAPAERAGFFIVPKVVE